MNFAVNFIKFFQTKTDVVPAMYGSFHLISIALSILLGIALCFFFRKGTPSRIRRTVLIISAIVVLSEIIRQITASATITEAGEILWKIDWYKFPFQFCSMPMYVGVLQGIFKKGKIHDALCAFLATYAIFAGICVMAFPSTIFASTAFLNIQTMLCHGTMVPIGVALMYSGHVKLGHKTILKAMAVFAVCLFCAEALNEIVYYSGILGEGEVFNMFYVSRHFNDYGLPIYSDIHNKVPFPINLGIYFCGFSFIAYLILLIGMGMGKLAGICKKD